MDDLERRRVRMRAVLLATAGLVFALVVGLGLKLLRLARMRWRDWFFCLGLTLGVQFVMWLIPRRGWDARFPWDRHYLAVPMLAVAFILDSWIYFFPDSRVLVLMCWYVALLFMAGLAGFRNVGLLSAAMAAGYVGALALSSGRGGPISLFDEIALAVVFWMTNLYAGLVFERLRHERREMQTLRRRLSELALTDPLTGLPNRRHFEDVVRNELARVLRYGGQCSVAMLDVDHFKNYNDVHGHPTGDAALKRVAEALRTELRSGDVAARYGGEEYALLMVSTDRADAIHVVDRLRRRIEATCFPHAEQQPPGRLTISAGVAECPSDASGYEPLVAKADAALYRAKSAGRNRVLGAGEP
jgi:diguanylate cyclase (GGDEF)-like protein